jgi:hypothetical protein
LSRTPPHPNTASVPAKPNPLYYHGDTQEETLASEQWTSKSGLDRRTFLTLAAGAAAMPGPSFAAGQAVALIADPADPIAASAPVQWAAAELQTSLTALGMSVQRHATMDQAPATGPGIMLAGARAPTAQGILQAAGTTVPRTPEALALVPSGTAAAPILLVCGSDVRGLVYAVTELTDRLRQSGDATASLHQPTPLVQSPANKIRSIARCFESVVEDTAWFHDRTMWREYLTMLVTHRINRFNMTFGVQYNYPMEVSDVYFYFTYPFLFAVPGHDIRVRGLPDDERDRNLETLRFIGQETARRGLDFQVGLWTHGYKFDSPRANYLVEGITPASHAPYCRDALALLLKYVPEIGGITFRIHGESGIPEGSYDFWKTVFDAFPGAGRKIEIDMHAKGMDQRTIDIALATGMPVKVSPKYLGEHLGLPYQESAIRAVDMPPPGGADDPHFSLSGGSRKFTRYSYADFLSEDRKHGVLFRVWPGTQRVLLWADPVFFAAYGRYSSFCSADGVELDEPLSFKGRMGSGRPGGRLAYADKSLVPAYDWEKYALTYRLWGRLTYDPDAQAETWQRAFAHSLGRAAAPAESALSKASRILALITSAHGPSASNNSYWPEIYTNMSVVQDELGRPYYDTPKPPRFTTVESFDAQMFARIDEQVQSLLSGEPDARYSPVEVAQWLDALATGAETDLHAMPGDASRNADLRRLVIDVRIQASIGRFFAAKLRSGVLWTLFTQTQQPEAAEAALYFYRAARSAWAQAARSAQVYDAQVSYGPEPWLRGHWRDRLPAIDADIAEMAGLAGDTNGQVRGDHGRTLAAIASVHAEEARTRVKARIVAPAGFAPGAPLALTIAVADQDITAARLHYRHVNQAEAWQVADATPANGGFAASVPAAYTSTTFPLQYYFELRGVRRADLFPGLADDLANQPYVVIRRNQAA